MAYVASSDGELYAFDAAGVTGCPGTPKTCAPLWTAALGRGGWSSPAVANGVVYIGSADGKLYAFDAAGLTNCSGIPKACAPLWTAPIVAGTDSSPTVVNGVVYVGARDLLAFSGKLYAFDAAGVAGCSGVPKTCAPLWSASTGGGIDASPAVANGVVYIGSGANFDSTEKLYAFDARGVTGCSGAPKTCAPLWTALTDPLGISSPAVANGVVYVGSGGTLYAFDAAGSTNCSGTPKTCAPLWTAATSTTGTRVSFSSPAVANGVVYIGSEDGKLYTFDAAGVTNCSGTPKTCTPRWTATTGGAIDSSPAVANGVVYIGSADFKLYAFDAAGIISCSGTPKSCTPLWTATTGSYVISSPAVVGGIVYVGSDDSKLHAFALPPA